MTHPGEVGLDWAMNRSKPDFWGRSVDILAASAPIRQLVGFSLDSAQTIGRATGDQRR